MFTPGEPYRCLAVGHTCLFNFLLHTVAKATLEILRWNVKVEVCACRDLFTTLYCSHLLEADEKLVAKFPQRYGITLAVV